MAITLRHNVTGATFVAPTEAAAAHWAQLGWERTEPAAIAATEVAGEPVAMLDDLTKEQLVALGAEHGLTLSERMSKDELLDAIRAHPEFAEEA